MQTRPATPTAAYELCRRDDIVYVADALVYPTAMIAKVIPAQVIVTLATRDGSS